MIKQDMKTGLWVVQYSKRHPITRKPKSLRRIGLKSRAEAQRVYNELVHKVNKFFEATTSGKMTYSALLEEFYAHLEERGLAKATVENYKLCLNAHTSNLWGSRSIDTISKPEIVQLIKVELAMKSPSHQKTMLKYIRGVFNYALDCGYLQRSPTPHLQFRTGNKFQKVLNKAQASLLLQKANEYNHEWKDIWAGALYTGMRNEELYALTWDKLDLVARQIRIDSVWTKKDGFKDLTKSGDDRIVEIALPLLDIFADLKNRNPNTSFVFPRISDWDNGRQAEILRVFLVGIGLPPVNFHNLRATWATLMLASGVEPVKVMKMGGWKDLKTLNNHYLRLAGVDIKGATDDFKL